MTYFCFECKKNKRTHEFEQEDLIIIERIFKNGTKHLEGKCPQCEMFLAFIPQNLPPHLWFGKYKGEFIADIFQKDPEYLSWLIKQEWLKPRLKTQIENIIHGENNTK